MKVGIILYSLAMMAQATVDPRPQAATPSAVVLPPKPLIRDGGPLIFIASDSTAQSYGEHFYPQTGWGQMLGCALKRGLGVENRAIGGRSSRTFIEEGRWSRLTADLRKGDVVLIQFAHNDANKTIPSRYAAAETTFRANLLRFIADVRVAGATPVLVTPIAQRMFQADGLTKAGFSAYSAVVRELGRTERVKVIDLEALSRRWIDKAGAERARSFYMNLAPGQYAAFAKGLKDDTHLSELGARGAANLVAGAYRDLRLPHWRLVQSAHPDLARATPLGHRGCH